MKSNIKTHVRIANKNRKRMIESLLDHYYFPSKMGWFTEEYEKQCHRPPTKNALRIFKKLKHDYIDEFIKITADR